MYRNKTFRCQGGLARSPNLSCPTGGIWGRFLPCIPCSLHLLGTSEGISNRHMSSVFYSVYCDSSSRLGDTIATASTTLLFFTFSFILVPGNLTVKSHQVKISYNFLKNRLSSYLSTSASEETQMFAY